MFTKLAFTNWGTTLYHLATCGFRNGPLTIQVGTDVLGMKTTAKREGDESLGLHGAWGALDLGAQGREVRVSINGG